MIWLEGLQGHTQSVHIYDIISCGVRKGTYSLRKGGEPKPCITRDRPSRSRNRKQRLV